ncbi:MAG: homoserine O-acetyltransferase [Xanthomonadales bacterium]|nr:homoserine O-acetyltransferase [Xanthomonadales bacterium]
MTPSSHLPTTLRFHTPEQPLLLRSGAVLESATIAFQTWGRLNARRDNVIWVCHALTASTDVASWWSALFGPGKALDPERHFIVCANVLGGCYGSHGPTSARPDGSLWQGEFPELSISDLVAHQRLLFEYLDLRGIELVLGGSMGGFQALEWALQEPHRVRRLALVATSWRQPPDAVALGELQCALIRQDADFAGGHYGADAAPQQGLALARQLGHYSYRGAEEFERRFGRSQRADGRLQVLSYLDHQGNKLVQRFDANSYLRLTAAMNRFDLAASEPAEQVLARIRVPTLVVAIESDRLYPPREQAALAEQLADGRLLRIDSPRGHDGFLADADRFESALRHFLQPSAAPLRVVSSAGEARAARPLALVGATGRVGSSLLELLQARPQVARLVAVANRAGAQLAGDGLSPEQALASLRSAGSNRLPLTALTRQLPPGTVIVDATAAPEVADHYRDWLQRGHAVVAANKLAFAGEDWAWLAEHTAQLGCSAVVGAGLPILTSLRRLHDSGDRLLQLQATLSGTLSFVLDQLHLGSGLADAVQAAVAQGLAEPDPAADLAGEDVARKLLIALRHAGLRLAREQIELAPLLPPRGAGQALPDWLQAGEDVWRQRLIEANQRGERWIYRASFDGQRAEVGAVSVPLDDPLAQGRGAANRALLWSEFHADQPLLIGGNGAGPRITAAALLADVASLPPLACSKPEARLRRIA